MTDVGVGLASAWTKRPGWVANVGGLSVYAFSVAMTLFGAAEGRDALMVLAPLAILGVFWAGNASLGCRVAIAGGTCTVRNPVVTTVFPTGFARSTTVEVGRSFLYSRQDVHFVAINLVNGATVRCFALAASAVAVAVRPPGRPAQLAPVLQDVLANSPSAPLTTGVVRRPTLPPWHSWLLAAVIALFALAALQLA